jgi:ribonuclease HII
MTRNPPPRDRFAHERQLVEQGLLRIVGVDEVGRGSLAGPVAAAAVILPREWVLRGIPAELEGLNDSKQLTASARERFHDAILACPEIVWAVEMIDADVIDQINILQATHRAMNQALASLSPAPDHVLVDGLRVSSITLPQTALVRGDSLSYSIAAASVLAKVTRDRLMTAHDVCYPGYAFARNKGYGTAAHLAALQTLGPSPIHRRTFMPSALRQAELFSS